MRATVLFSISIFLVVSAIGCGGGSSKEVKKKESSRPDRSTGNGSQTKATQVTTDDQINQGNLNLIWTPEMKQMLGSNEIVVQMLELDDIVIVPGRNARKIEAKTIEHREHNEKMIAAIEKTYGKDYLGRIKTLAHNENEKQRFHGRSESWKKDWKKAKPLNQ